MSLILSFPAHYGYSVFVALVGIPILCFIQGNIAGAYRRPAKVLYPYAYATPEQVKSNDAAYTFNCAQRAHVNLLENVSQVIAQILVAGLFYPRVAALLGAAWIVSRVVYAYGYITSPPGSGGKKRLVGSSFWLCQIGLMGLCAAVAAVALKVELLEFMASETNVSLLHSHVCFLA